MLAIVHATEQFHQVRAGVEVQVQLEHRLHEAILTK